MMTARELIDRCVDIAEHYKTLYVMGCFGAPMTAANKKRYTQNHSYNKAAARTKMINAASADTFGFDCVNLIKGVLWGWDGDTSAQYGGAKYGSNGVPDVSADGMIRLCKGVTDDFRDIVPGAAVWMPGHIGLYIGDGLAVECTPKWENKVQITAVGNLGKKTGYNARTWKKWGVLPYVSYKEEETVTYEQWKEFMDRYRKELGEKPVPAWAQNNGEWEAAKEAGIITPSTKPQDLCTKGLAGLLVVQGERRAEITPKNFPSLRELIARQNGIELPDETDNAELVAAKRYLSQQGAIPLKADVESLIYSVAVTSKTDPEDILNWTVRRFQATERALDRSIGHLVASLTLAAGGKFKGGNPYPSWKFDREETTGFETLDAFRKRVDGVIETKS